jgi:hypothetical protein
MRLDFCGPEAAGAEVGERGRGAGRVGSQGRGSHDATPRTPGLPCASPRAGLHARARGPLARSATGRSPGSWRRGAPRAHQGPLHHRGGRSWHVWQAGFRARRPHHMCGHVVRPLVVVAVARALGREPVERVLAARGSGVRGGRRGSGLLAGLQLRLEDSRAHVEVQRHVRAGVLVDG